MKRALLALVCLSLGLTACSRTDRALQITGSDTMVNLAQAWAEKFMAGHPEASIAVTGGGSGTGFAALISGTTDIAQASREIKQKEVALSRKRGVEPVETHVASDGIVVVVHPANPVRELSIGQLSGIFTGQVRNWRQVGGGDLSIVALSRERNSGTHVFFLEEIVKLGKKKNPNEFAADVLMMPSSQAIVEEVMANPSAVGYIGYGYLNSRLKALSVSRDGRSAAIYPTVDSIKRNRYPVSRSLHFYTCGQPQTRVKEFISYVMSPAGQAIVREMDFIPVK